MFMTLIPAAEDAPAIWFEDPKVYKLCLAFEKRFPELVLPTCGDFFIY